MSLDTRPGFDDIEGVPAPSATPFVLGHDEVWSDFVMAASTGRLHHAWLMQGTSGIGKATTAFGLARHLMGVEWRGDDRTRVFDATGSIFRQIAQGGHPNVVHVRRAEADRGEGFKTQITIDEVRRLQHFFQSTTASGWRVAIIDPVDDLNRNAANALLKILEEPPARSIFLLVNHSPGRILPTIRSRCRVVRMGKLSDVQVALGMQRLLGSSGPDTSQATKLGRGSLRDALNFQLSGSGDVVEAVQRLVGAPDTDWTLVHSVAESITGKGREAGWSIFEAAVFDRLAEAAKAALNAGNTGAAARLSGLWESERLRWNEALAYNIDRKQIVLTFFHNLERVRAA